MKNGGVMVSYTEKMVLLSNITVILWRSGISMASCIEKVDLLSFSQDLERGIEMGYNTERMVLRLKTASSLTITCLVLCTKKTGSSV
jgi:hypothetical protein